MLRLEGTPQYYAWGSTDAISAILGSEPDGQPLAEYWYGAHPFGDSRTSTGQTLSQVLGEQPEVLGAAATEAFGSRLPFLVKFLSAAMPLSLQAHPSRTQAQDGYARESLLGVPLDAPHRSYKDDWPKPETIIALTPFEGLLGFRDPATTASLFSQLGVSDDLASIIGPLKERTGVAALQEVFLDILSLNRRRHLVNEVLAAAVQHLDADGELGQFARTAVELDEHFPGDPGIIAALLLNRFSLLPGESVSVEAGVMHAYLKGTGVEVMANSDNVLRGGLTQKHIDVDSLLQVVSFEPLVPEIHSPEGSDGIYRYPGGVAEFEVWLVQPVAANPLELPRPDSGRICVAAEGEFTLQAADEELHLRAGQAAFVPAGEQVRVTGQGQLFAVACGA